MDEADLADVDIERTLAWSLRAVRSAPILAATGLCLSCEKDLEPPRRWCDASCRDQYERAAEAARRNIRVTSDD